MLHGVQTNTHAPHLVMVYATRPGGGATVMRMELGVDSNKPTDGASPHVPPLSTPVLLDGSDSPDRLRKPAEASTRTVAEPMGKVAWGWADGGGRVCHRVWGEYLNEGGRGDGDSKHRGRTHRNTYPWWHSSYKSNPQYRGAAQPRGSARHRSGQVWSKHQQGPGAASTQRRVGAGAWQEQRPHPLVESELQRVAVPEATLRECISTWERKNRCNNSHRKK